VDFSQPQKLLLRGNDAWKSNFLAGDRIKVYKGSPHSSSLEVHRCVGAISWRISRSSNNHKRKTYLTDETNYETLASYRV
jgi:hypothetical protein